MFNDFKERKISTDNNLISERVNRKKESNILIKLLILIIIILGVIGGIIYYGYIEFKTNILITDEIIIEIEEGELPITIATKLGLNENYLKFYFKNEAPEFELLTGKFKIEADSNIENILKAFKKPIIEGETDITILEGWNIYDIDAFLNKKGLIIENEYINYVQNIEKIGKLTEYFPFIKGLYTLEGFLYPDTYRVKTENFKINEFVIKQLDNFEAKVYNEIITHPGIPSLKSNGMKHIEIINELVNLSSIVEKEEKNLNAKSTVAGILKKRLNNGWMIGADITVCYPHELTAEECKMVISKYINEKSEYNTRTMQGLPKTPIGNPSYETINATLNSKDTEYWFYLHDTRTGKIYYGKDNAEHEQNKRLYMK